MNSKTKVSAKSGADKPIAKKTATGKKVAPPDALSDKTTEKQHGPFAENFLPIENEKEQTSKCAHFYNMANEGQKAYVKKLIEDRMLRENIKFEHLVFSLAEMFDYDPLHAYWGSTSLNALLKVLYKNQSVLSGMPSYERRRAMETLENLSEFLEALHRSSSYKVLFDRVKMEEQTTIGIHDIVDMQRRHAERTIVDDGVFVFDLSFNIPFNELSEEAKVDRLRLYLREHKDWTDETLVLPEYVKQYLPQAQQMLQAENQTS